MDTVAPSISSAGRAARIRDRLHAWLLLTKPGIVLLAGLTGIAALVLEGSLLAEPRRLAGVLLGILLAAGAAGALNQFWDRDIDARMARTRSRRPIPTGRIGPAAALWFGLSAGTASILLLKSGGSTLAAVLGAGSMAHYLLVYTIWLKRRTRFSIVIGGAAGAAPPLIGWSAGAGELSLMPLLMGLVIFLWTPPHFLALALCRQEEYALAGIPLWPETGAEARTHKRIGAYAALLLAAALWLGLHAELGWLYLAGSTLLGSNLARRILLLRQRRGNREARELFTYSIFYLAALFTLMLVSGW